MQKKVKEYGKYKHTIEDDMFDKDAEPNDSDSTNSDLSDTDN